MSVTSPDIRSRLKDFGKTSDLFNIPVRDIQVDPEFNIRLDTPELAQHIEWLRGQIRDYGFLRSKPLIVRLTADKRVVLVDGHCRLTAVRLCNADGAGIDNLPCLPEGKGVSDIDRTLLMFSANSGLNHSPLEQALGVKRLLSYGLTEVEIGKRIGKTRQHVANLLELAGAPEGVRMMVVQGNLAATEAVKTIRREGANATAVLQDAAERTRAAGKTKVTAKVIEAGKHGVIKPRVPHLPPGIEVTVPRGPAAGTVVPRVLQDARVPLQVAAAHVVEMAEGETLPPGLMRAIKTLAASLAA